MTRFVGNRMAQESGNRDQVGRQNVLDPVIKNDRMWAVMGKGEGEPESAREEIPRDASDDFQRQIIPLIHLKSLARSGTRHVGVMRFGGVCVTVFPAHSDAGLCKHAPSYFQG